MEPQQGSDTRLTHVGVPSLIKIMGIEHREDTVGGGGREHAGANTQTHTHSVTRDILDGWSLGRGSDTILTHVGEAPTNQINEL